jgi:hypothetical protein
MRVSDGQLLLAPSDLDDFVECRHLTDLNLETAAPARIAELGGRSARQRRP